MPPTAKSIREDLARAKASYARNEDLRTLQLTISALRGFLTTRLPGPERTRVEGLLRECFGNISKLERVKKRLPHGIPYLKGKEKKLYEHLIPLAKLIEDEINRETLDAMRERKLRIDQAIIRGTKLLGEGNLPEAQRQFRAAVDDYVDEKGLFPLIASRLIEAGHFKPALEYVKRAVEEGPDNPRAYDFLWAVADKADEWDSAEKILVEARHRHGDQPLLLACLAKIKAKRGEWEQAREAAKQALAGNPHLEEASKILILAEKKLEHPTA